MLLVVCAIAHIMSGVCVCMRVRVCVQSWGGHVHMNY